MAQRGIQSVEVGGRLLLALAEAGRPMPLKDLAQAAGMPAAKAHPYLVSFGKLGLIVQDGASGHYGLGPLAMQLGLISLQQFDPIRLATERLPELARAVGHTVAIAVWGERGPTIIVRELLPNVADLLLVEFALRSSSALLLVSALSFLGLGLTPPTPDWGLMVHAGLSAIHSEPWLILIPALCISSLVIGVNFATEGLADAFGLDAARGSAHG